MLNWFCKIWYIKKENSNFKEVDVSSYKKPCDIQHDNLVAYEKGSRNINLNLKVVCIEKLCDDCFSIELEVYNFTLAKYFFI